MFAYLLSITRIERSALLYVAAFSTVGFGYVGLTGVLGNLYILGLGFDTAFLGTLAITGQLVWALAALPAGMIGARYGLRGTVIAGWALIVITSAAYICVPLLPKPTWSAGLILVNILFWASVSLMAVNGVPYLMAITPEGQRGQAFTLQTAVFPVAAFAGSLLGGFLPGLFSRLAGPGLDESGAYRAALAVAVLSYLISAVLMILAHPAPPLPRAASGELRQAAPLGLMVFLGALFTVQLSSEAALFSFLNIYFAKNLLVTTALIGVIFAVVRLLPFFASPLLPLAFNRWGSGLTLTACYGVMVLAALSMAFLHHWIATGVAFFLANLASSFASTARSLFGQESVMPAWRTTISAVTIISLAAGNGLSGFAGGRLIEVSGYQSLFLVSAGLALVSVLMYAARRWKKVQAPAATLAAAPIVEADNPQG